MGRMARRRIDRKARAKMVSASPGQGGGWTQGVASEWKLRLRDLELRLERLESEKRRLLEARQQLEAVQPENQFTEGAATGVVTLDPQGRILEINEAAVLLLGRERASLLRRRFAVLLAPQDIPRLLSQLRRCVCSGQRVCEALRLRRTEAGPVLIQFACRPVLDSGGRATHLEGTFIDITDLKGAENALRQTESWLQAILDNSPAVIFLKDLKGRYLHVNRRFERMFHCVLEETVGRTDAELFAAEQAAVFRANELKVVQAGALMVFEEETVHDDGPHTGLATRFPIFDGKGKIYAIAGIVVDITERKRLEAEVLKISEREQRRIAQDLHDGLGQHLAGILHLTAALQAKLSERSLPEAADADRILKLLGDTMGQVRTLAKGLFPVQPDDRGLASSLEQLTVLVKDLFGIDCRFESPRPVPIPDPVVATHLFRVAQEAINNAIKHGRATHITVGLAQVAKRIVLTVRNNGMAIPDEPSSNGGIGLRIMQNRATTIGGSLVIVSDARRGTTVICMVPGQDAGPTGFRPT